MGSVTISAARSAPPLVEPPQPARSRAYSPAVAGLICLALLYSLASLLAVGIRYLSTQPRLAGLLATVSEALLNPANRVIAEFSAAALVVALALWKPWSVSHRFHAVSRALDAFAHHKRLAIVFAALVPMVIRLALLPVLGVPEPLIADEFGYLLIADTFASGRLANPPHPLWPHFESIYAFHQPAYASIYPVAPALLLLAAKLLGLTPWLGVWFGAGLMCALICWMLQGWAPPAWAFAGALIAACRFAIIGPWMNTYWGGAAAAAGGALLMGALPRIMKTARIRDSLLFALGLVILAQSRPYEGFLLSIPVVGFLVIWLLTTRAISRTVRVRRILVPLCACMLLLVAGTMYYNWRVTGNPMLMPYTLHQKIYGTPQSFYWQAPILDAPGIHRHQDIRQVFEWQLDAYRSQFSWPSVLERLHSFWQFYLHPLLTIPLLLALFSLRDRRIWILVAAAALVMVGNTVYPFFFPHYAAPLAGLLMLLIALGLRRLSRMEWRSAPVGRAVSAGLITAVVASTAFTTIGGMLQPLNIAATNTPRGQALRQLRAIPGKHLVLVRYSPRHSFHYGVVYNDASIDDSPVVWAREMDDAGNERLLEYFSGRRAWRFNPDELPARLTPFTTKPFISKVVPGAGRRDDTHDGVSPGSIAVLLGGNFAKQLHGTTVENLLGPLPFRTIETGPVYGNAFTLDQPHPSSADRAVTIDTPSLSVRFGSLPARVLGISNFAGQESITVQVPAPFPAGKTTVTLRVGRDVTTAEARILPAAPGIFQARMSDGAFRAIVTTPDGAPVDLARRAPRKQRLRLYATGLGPMLQEKVAGKSAPASTPAYPLVVGVNHHGAPLLSAGPAPDMPGVIAVDFEIPDDVPPGTDVPLSLGVVVNGEPVYSNKSSLPVE